MWGSKGLLIRLVVLLGLRYEIILPMNLAVDHLLHFLKPAKFVLHLCYLGHSQRPPFLFVARQIRKPIEEAVCVIKFVFHRLALSSNLGGRLVVLSE